MSGTIETLSGFSIFALLILFASPISSITRIPVVVVEMILGALAAYFFGFIHEVNDIQIIAEVGFLFLINRKSVV